MSKEFLDAFADLKKEKNLSEAEIIGAIKDSIENAYRKNYGASNVRVDVDMTEGNVTVYMGMEVVEEVEDYLTQISIEDAKEIYDGYEIGDVVEYEIDPRDFNRIAAQGAKQVFVQKNREAERTNSYNENYRNRQGGEDLERHHAHLSRPYRRPRSCIRAGKDRELQAWRPHQSVCNGCQEREQGTAGPAFKIASGTRQRPV